MPVHLGSAGTMIVIRLDEEAEQWTLRPETWCAASRRWVSATPIALDRNPGDLRSTDPHRAARAIGEAEAGIRLACRHIGLPEPAEVTVLPSPALAGAAKVRSFPAFPGTEGRFQRVLTHAAVEFSEPICGPLLLGAGRYIGLGLMRPAGR